MAIVRKGIAPRIQPVEPTESGADPETAFTILVQGHHRVVGQAFGVFALMVVRLKAVAVIPVQTIGSSEPQESVVILHDALDPALQRFPIYGYSGEADILLINQWQLQHAVLSNIEEVMRFCVTAGDIGRPKRISAAMTEKRTGLDGNLRSRGWIRAWRIMFIALALLVSVILPREVPSARQSGTSPE